MKNYTVVIRVRGMDEYVTRSEESEITRIAEEVKRTGRFNGYKAIVVKVFKW